jgi:hypothetical protein
MQGVSRAKGCDYASTADPRGTMSGTLRTYERALD